MQHFELNGETYQLPESLAEVPLRDFIRLSEIQSNPDLTTYERTCAIVSSLTYVPYELLTQCEAKLVFKLSAQLNFLDLDVIHPHGSPMQSFTYSGETFQVHSLSKATFEEFIAYEKASETPAGHPPIARLPYQLAVLCRLVGESFSAVPLIERAELFRNLPTNTALRIAANFTLAGEHSSTLSGLYSDMVPHPQNPGLRITTGEQMLLINPDWARTSGTPRRINLSASTAGSMWRTVWRKLVVRCLKSLLNRPRRFSTT